MQDHLIEKEADKKKNIDRDVALREATYRYVDVDSDDDDNKI